MASEERSRDLRRETTQFQEATRVFKVTLLNLCLSVLPDSLEELPR